MEITGSAIQTAIIDSAEEAGLRAIELAAAVGVTEGAARKWFDRKTVPAADTLLRLVRALPRIGHRLGIELRQVG